MSFNSFYYSMINISNVIDSIDYIGFLKKTNYLFVAHGFYLLLCHIPRGKITETVLEMFKNKLSKKLLSDIIDKAQVFFCSEAEEPYFADFWSVEWPAAAHFHYAHIVHRFLFFGSKVGHIVLFAILFLLPWPKRWIVNRAPPLRLLLHILLYMFLCCLLPFFLIKACDTLLTNFAAALPCSLAPHYCHMQHATC